MRAWTEDERRSHGTTADEAHSTAASSNDGDAEHAGFDHSLPHTHPHPRPAGASPDHPTVGIIGAGPVGSGLAVAIARAGWPVVAVASRDPTRRDALRSRIPGLRGFSEPAAILDEAELIFLTVPDDVVPAIAADLRLYGGQALVHTSGVLSASVLESARAAGSQLGSFHPLVAFTSDVERSVAALRGATVALEGDPARLGVLADLAEAVGALPVRLAPGGRPAYHAAAVLAAGGVVALLDAIAELGRAAGLDEAGSLAIYGRLIEQTLGNARANGIASALTGPIVRGDMGTVRAHLHALAEHAPAAMELYLAAARREVSLAEERGALAPEQAEGLRRSLAKPA